MTSANKNINSKNYILWIPLVIMLAIVPLLIHMKQLNITDYDLADAWNGTTEIDIYSQYKAIATMILTGITLVFMFFTFDNTRFKWNIYIMLIFIGIGLLILISLISTVTSKNPSVAWWGMPDRAEGMAIWICYIILFLSTIYAYESEKNFWFVTLALTVLIVVLTILGIAQFIGKDLISQTDFFRKLILTKEAYDQGATISSQFGKGIVYATLYHYNYMGSFGALMFPLFITLALFYKDNKAKILFWILSACTLFLLLGSTSRAGLIGLVCAVILFIIVYWKQIIKKWKISLGVIIAFIVLLVGANVVTDNMIFRRIPTLVSDFVEIFKSTKEIDPLGNIPVRDMYKAENNKYTFVLQDGKELSIISDNIIPKFVDENNESINYVSQATDIGMNYYTSEMPYSEFNFAYQTTTSSNYEGEVGILTMHDSKQSLFKFLLLPDRTALLDSYPTKEIEAIKAPSIGFKGKEQLGSSRGYIWSRSLPLLKKTILKGFGPDTFVINFPQNDFIGKWVGYDTPIMTVDKAHNLYLQLWINNGCLAFIGFALAIITYVVWSLKLYAFKTDMNNNAVIGTSILFGVIGYLGAGIFNDSVISVAPIFWILLGVGVAVNYKQSEWMN